MSGNIRIKRKGIYGKGFLSESRQQQQAKIRQEENKLGPATVDEEMAALNSFTYRDSNEAIRRNAELDLKYAESLKSGKMGLADSTPSAFSGPAFSSSPDNGTGQLSNIAWDRQRITYDTEHHEPQSNSDWAREEIAFDKNNNGEPAKRGILRGENKMSNSVGKCPVGQEYVAPHMSKYDGRPVHVKGFCRDKANKVTPKDRAKFRADGKRAKGSTWGKKK